MGKIAVIHSGIRIGAGMGELQESLATLVRDGLDNQLSWIIDDEIEQADLIPQLSWDIFREELKEHTVLGRALFEALSGETVNFETAPSRVQFSEFMNQWKETIPESLNGPLNECLNNRHVLSLLTESLQNIGMKVERFHYRPPEGASSPFLVMLDFNILPESDHGAQAASILRELMKRAFEKSVAPPFVILMSKALDESKKEILSAFAHDAGFFRFNFEFLPKQAIEQDQETFYFALTSFLQHRRVSSAYFEQIHGLEAAASAVVSKVAKRLLQITPSEARLFQSRMRREGTQLSEVLTELFNDSFAANIRSARTIQRSMLSLEDAIAAEGLPVSKINQEGALHEICGELLHIPSQADHENPRFGDIYEGDSGKLLLVLTQECDLGSGGARVCNLDRIFGLEGSLKERDSVEDDGPVVSKPFKHPMTKKAGYVWWNLRKPVVVQIKSFSPITELDFGVMQRTYHKVCRLRFTDADQIQQAFASHLTRVGIDVHPAPIQEIKGLIRTDNRDYPIALYFLRQEVSAKKYDNFVAISPDSRTICLKHSGLTLTSIHKLSCFQSVTEFSRVLKVDANFLGNIEGQPILFKILNGKLPKGVSPWTGTK
jgi:hypothetical protein